LIIIMSAGSSQDDVKGVLRHLDRRGLRGQLNEGVERTVIGVLGAVYPELQIEMDLMPGVSETVPISKPYKLASREFAPDDTVVKIGKDGVAIGGGNFVVFAGPCAVESEEQMIATATAVQNAGAKVLRGGAFKPRTSPYSFRGLGEDGLKILATAREETGLPVITEVMSPGDVELVSGYADVLQIGARNMQNYSLLDEVGKTDKPVMVKRGFSATYEDWLLSAEYVMAGGNLDVILCERGIRTFESFTRNTMDLNAVPAIHRLSHLPVVADPSHGTGKWYLVTPMARAAAAVGADGLIIEVHPNPDEAKSDGPQSLTFENFAKLMTQVKMIRDTVIS
jgi:3-deoxy-7-phosphoheptulonate synthase